jgi:uncharacterized protein
MSAYDDLIRQVFLHVRRDLALGMTELFDALRVAEMSQPDDPAESLRDILELLWCKSTDDHSRLYEAWEATRQNVLTQPQLPVLEKTDASHQKPSTPPQRRIEPPPDRTPTESRGPQFAIIPFRPPYAPGLDRDQADLQHYYPVTRRYMRYTWHSLRRDLPDGPADVLDLEETVEQTARQGFFLAPTYRRRLVNHARLMLLLDYHGSMMPFHHYLRDLVETARFESTLADVDVYYFRNVPQQVLFADPYLQEKVAVEAVLETVDEFTSVLIVSDAGAARRHNELDRIVQTEFFLEDLYRVTRQVAWLNPMPQTRWESTSAEALARVVPMFPMHEEGMSGALDVLRGLAGGTQP